ncbi:peptidylprolyl isomerase [Marmoricola sp. OAE513]|uniref:hypothetical protein n=1 Tax=Marmoricola sp. OAE513 TaxID=2817894 RepID=UPI001AE3C19D
MTRSRNAALALAAALVLVASGCSGSGSTAATGGLQGVTVDGEPGTEPTVRLAPPLKVEEVEKSVVVTGTGAPIVVDQLFVLQVTLYDGRTGKRAASTYEKPNLPVLAKTTDGSLFPALNDALVGLRQGSRLAMVLPSADAFGSEGVPPKGIRPEDPVVVVADVIAVPSASVLRTARGTAVAAAAGAPRVELVAGDPTRVTFPAGTSEPDDVVVIPLIEGDGPKVPAHGLATVDYLGQSWGSRDAFVDTYFKEPAVVPIGAQLSLPAWDAGLVGVRTGSRVLILDPNPTPTRSQFVDVPGRGTIAWVVDVLGVS